MTNPPTPSAGGITAEKVAELRRLERKLPPGPWELWTSCSYRRITGQDGKVGGVLHAYNQRGDGHPDLSMPEDQLQALVDIRNALPDVLALAEASLSRPASSASAETREKVLGIVSDALESAIPEGWEVAAHATNRILALPEFAALASTPTPAADHIADAGKMIAPTPAGEETFQARVQPWMMACFGPEISADKLERNDRFIEEALELVQASDYPKARAHELVEYVYGRDQGEINQEVGGVMVTLAAHCLAHGVDMHAAAETELARIWTKVEQIRAKQAAKPKGSALPIAVSPPSDALAGVKEALTLRISKDGDGYEAVWASISPLHASSPSSGRYSGFDAYQAETIIALVQGALGLASWRSNRSLLSAGQGEAA